MNRRTTCATIVVFAMAAAAGCDRTAPAQGGATKAPAAADTANDPCSPAEYDRILGLYVKEGRVDYAALKTNHNDLARFNTYLGGLDACDVNKLDKLSQHAFWINAYNAFNIKGVLDHWPTKNIKEIDGFLDKKAYSVAGMQLTLNDMEYKQLIPVHKDGRAHFAVVCADLGSVPLESRAYTAANLEQTLEKKTGEFVRDPRNFRIDRTAKTVFISQLFEWYAKDFTSDPRFKGQHAVDYLIPYVDEATADFLRTGDYKVVFIDWDWSLNAPLQASR